MDEVVVKVKGGLWMRLWLKLRGGWEVVDEVVVEVKGRLWMRLWLKLRGVVNEVVNRVANK